MPLAPWKTPYHPARPPWPFPDKLPPALHEKVRVPKPKEPEGEPALF